MIKVKRIGSHDFANPMQQTHGSVGYDLISTVDVVLQPGEQVLVPTGFAWEIPENVFGLIRDRSGIAVKRRLTTRAGVIDSDYRGEIKVVLINESSEEQKVHAGERIAQLVLLPAIYEEIEEVDEFSKTERGERGFGSTGC